MRFPPHTKQGQKALEFPQLPHKLAGDECRAMRLSREKVEDGT